MENNIFKKEFRKMTYHASGVWWYYAIKNIVTGLKFHGIYGYRRKTTARKIANKKIQEFKDDPKKVEQLFE